MKTLREIGWMEWGLRRNLPQVCMFTLRRQIIMQYKVCEGE